MTPTTSTVGEETPHSARGPTVVVLHGFAGRRFMNLPLARMLRLAGYRPVDLSYASWRLSLSEICDQLAPRLARADEESDIGSLHVVAHSMGGLVARALIHHCRPKSLGRVVMLGTPNGGSEIADVLQRQILLRQVLGKAAPALLTRRPAAIEAMLGTVNYPLGIVAGSRPVMPIGALRLVPVPSDGKVSVASTRLAEATDHIVLPLPHALLPYHSSAHRQIRHFLRHGHFQHQGEV